MNNKAIDRLHNQMIHLRKAIEKAKTEGRNDIPKVIQWPRNCCAAAYPLLYLQELGYENIVKHVADTSNLDENRPDHLWLEIDGVIIDLTADQFDKSLPGVIVASKSDWHASLTEKPASAGWATHGYLDGYAKLKAYL